MTPEERFEQARKAHEAWRQEHREAMSKIYSLVAQIEKLINAMRRPGEWNGQS